MRRCGTRRKEADRRAATWGGKAGEGSGEGMEAMRGGEGSGDIF
jgi:hypothetical protein